MTDKRPTWATIKGDPTVEGELVVLTDGEGNTLPPDLLTDLIDQRDRLVEIIRAVDANNDKLNAQSVSLHEKFAEAVQLLDAADDVITFSSDVRLAPDPTCAGRNAFLEANRGGDKT